MCLPVFGPPLAAAFQTVGSAVAGAVGGAFGGGAAAAGGAGMTVGQLLQVGGALAGVGGSIAQGRAEASAARMNATLTERQARHEAMLAVVEDERTRARMRMALAQQRAELAGRGIQLDSPTAILLGRQGAEELSFASQSVRSRSLARGAELGIEARSWRSKARAASLGGRLSAAGSLLTAAPDLWPGLADRRLLS